MMGYISNGDRIIDSRDVIARIAELESGLQDAHASAVEEWKEDTDSERSEDDKPDEDFETWLKEAEDEEAHELRTLRAFLTDITARSGEAPKHGATLIADHYFEDYARELAEDCFGVREKDGWPFDYIDWGRAAEALQMDYAQIDFDGEPYWVRS